MFRFLKSIKYYMLFEKTKLSICLVERKKEIEKWNLKGGAEVPKARTPSV